MLTTIKSNTQIDGSLFFFVNIVFGPCNISEFRF